jgi:hypothetical protein
MLTSYCGGRSGRLKRLQPKFRKGRHCRVEQGCDPSDPRRNLFEQLQLLASLCRFRNRKTGGVAARTLSPDKKLAGLVITVQEFSTMRPAPGRPHRRAIAWA